jgi:hypothetical protein
MKFARNGLGFDVFSAKVTPGDHFETDGVGIGGNTRHLMMFFFAALILPLNYS